MAHYGPMPDFNNGPGNDLNSSRSLELRRLFDTDVNNDPQAIPTLSDGVYICSGLLLMVSWQVPYLSKGRRPDFNNGLGDLNSGPVMTPWRLFESDSNNGPFLGHSAV